MSLAELKSPIRLYWDLDSAENDAVVADSLRIAGEIAANKILSLQITERAPALSSSCLAVLDAFKTGSMAVSLVASHSALDRGGLARLRDLSVKVVFASVFSLSELDAVLQIVDHAGKKPAIGVSFPVTRDNFRDLPQVLSFCISHRISPLLLPMQRLMEKQDCFVFSAEERLELTGRLSAIDRPSWLQVIIHDPFLWRAFFPAVEFPNGGCQAANTMVYLSPDLDLYPCPTLPIKLGNLRAVSFKEMIHSDRKKDVRSSILEFPSECLSCADLNQCKGGCRGRVYTLTNSLNEPDPACR